MAAAAGTAFFGGDGGAVFCVAMLWLSVVSMLIFSVSSAVDDGARRLPMSGRGRGPVFVGGKGCPCGGCRAGVGVCGTYLS